MKLIDVDEDDKVSVKSVGNKRKSSLNEDEILIKIKLKEFNKKTRIFGDKFIERNNKMNIKKIKI